MSGVPDSLAFAVRTRPTIQRDNRPEWLRPVPGPTVCPASLRSPENAKGGALSPLLMTGPNRENLKTNIFLLLLHDLHRHGLTIRHRPHLAGVP